jgi:hypothetical protein
MAMASSLSFTVLVMGKSLIRFIFKHKVTDMDDRIGYGQHGDYLFGWKDNALQTAMDALPSGKCANANCSVLKVQSAQTAMTCKKAQQVVEDVGKDGEWISQLPGGAPVTYT